MTTTPTAPDRTELVGRAEDLHVLLQKFADYGDARRRTADEVIEALRRAGMFRLFTPARFGGYEIDLDVLIDVTEVLGAADGSAAWLVGIAATSTWMAAHGSDEMQAEVFGTDVDARLAGGGAGVGTGRAVSGGHVVNGRWAYASGSHHASWMGVMTMLDGAEGTPPTPGFVIVPATDTRIEDTWHTAGLRGTGSNTLVANDVFVPEHRIIPMSAFGGDRQSERRPLYRLPLSSVGSLCLVGPLLGIGESALDHVIESASEKAIPHTVFTAQSESVGVQLQVADAALRLQTARLHVNSVATTLMGRARDGRDHPPRYLVQASAQTAYAARQIRRAVDILIDVHGSAALADANPLQRKLRDVSIGTSHASLDAGVSNEVFGKALLGVQEQVILGP